MATKKSTEGVHEKDGVTSVKPLDADTHDEDYGRAQNEALANYKATGYVGTYIDPTRDQEPDIAPELGVYPHPELANPAVSGFSAVPLDPDKNAVTKSVGRKEEDGKEAAEAFNENYAERQKRYEEAQEAGSSGSEGVPPPVQDESPKSSQGNPASSRAGN